MFKITLGALALVLSLGQAGAATTASRLTFVGDALVAKPGSPGTEGNAIEFGPHNETDENWTRRVGYRAFLDSKQSASEAAAALGRETRERFPGSAPRLYERGSEAVVEFALAAADGTTEYNLFRYAAGPGGRGLVSLHYARRLRGKDLRAMPRQAPRWAAEIARFDMDRVRAAFDQPRG